MSKKSHVISIRINDELNTRLLNLENASGIDKATIIRNSLEGVIDQAEKDQQLTFPYKMIPVKMKLTAIAILLSLGFLSYKHPQKALQISENVIEAIYNLAA